MLNTIRTAIKESIQTKDQILQSPHLLSQIKSVSKLCIRAYQNKHKVLFCGNGGSAADAQHLSAELTGRFYIDREPLFSEALHVNTSYLTAVANDYSYDEIYSRLVKAKCESGDILIGLSTSGNSKNIVKAFELAQSKGIKTVGLTGETGGKLAGVSDYLINVPSTDTPRIQECHILIGHIICQLTEQALFQHEK